jgi:hypothetical protein
MKKIKLMLMSLALLAVVGGALAFKARFQNTWCITSAKLSANGLYTCPAALNCGTSYAINAATTIDQPLPGFTTFCSTQTNGLNPAQFDICTDAVGVTKKCVNTVTLKTDAGGGALQTVQRHS